MEEQNKELNLAEILKDSPKGTKLYSPLYGEVFFDKILNDVFPIQVSFCINNEISFDVFADDGRWEAIEGAECMLFPSKDSRDWSTFNVEKPKWNPETLQPFDKVLVRDINNERWIGELFLYRDVSEEYPFIGLTYSYKHCIPYNEETKHLLGTTDEAPEYYRV